MTTTKFKSLVHYVVESCQDPHRLGATRLNKICWFADTFTYRLTGTSITGETYVKRQRGPVPKTILSTLRELENEGKIHIREREFASYKMRIFMPLAAADKSMFSAVELEIIDSVIHEICNNQTASSISEISHDQIWEAANDGEEIPLQATLAGQRADLRPEIISWADSVIERVESGKQQAA